MLLVAAGLASMSGCMFSRVKWREPKYVAPLHSGLCGLAGEPSCVEKLYAQALEQENECLESCVDLYFQVAVATSTHQSQCDDCRLCRLHQSALTKLVVTGQCFGRLDPRGSLRIRWQGSDESIAITHHGFVWQAEDFCQLTPVGNYKTGAIKKPNRRSGVGIPLVVTGCPPSAGEFLDKVPVFAATLRMSVTDSATSPDGGDANHPRACQLELYDPIRVDSVYDGDQPRRLASDLSAPFIYRLRDETRLFLDGFINPTSEGVESRLFAIEPYQPKKIPVIFVHGLLSDPFTWLDMINQLQRQPGFVDHYQIWLFEYPTGRSFLASAASLREQLQLACGSFDPQDSDPQLSNIVLVGHSMGGLVSKLQVTSSGDQLWRAVANRPFDQVLMRPELRQKLAAQFFFDPSPRISRVVYIGTPHHGANDASRTIGRISSALVTISAGMEAEHEELISCNPGVFTPEVSRRVPTSIDVLEPESCLLKATTRLPMSCRVRAHTVLGNHCGILPRRHSDGVVPVESAREDRAITERRIKATHTRLNKHADAIEEVNCLLKQHLIESAEPSIQQARLLKLVAKPVVVSP